MALLTIGAATVERIEEVVGPSFEAGHLLPDWDAAVLEELPWLIPRHFHARTGRFIGSLHSWLIRTKHHTILVDTCAGNDKHRPHSPLFHMRASAYLDKLRAAGVAPEDVDFVLCTHLHVDHVGWNTQLKDGRWVPTFPNAKYVFSRTDRDYWDPEKNPGLDEEARLIFTDSIHPVLAAGQGHLVDMQDALGDNLLIEPAPGHTPGHILLRLKGGGGQGVFTGDVMHHPVQVYRPDWSSRFCFDPRQSALTRRNVLADCADCGAYMLPAHFGPPFTGRVKEKGGKFSFEWIED